ncbi:MAG TPA: GWxTD domain-containing protein [Acidisarcina sp.]
MLKYHKSLMAPALLVTGLLLLCGGPCIGGAQTPAASPAAGAQQPSVPAAQNSAPANSATPPDQVNPSGGSADDADPLKRKLSDKERFNQQKEVRQELKGPYKKWVNEDVHWIITDEELKAFRSLSNDEERDNFIENFWLRRNPNPDSPDNEFREEHYRRIQYANERFAAGKAGWRTDRGHIYIAFGKPDSVETHPSGGTYERPIEEGGGSTSTFPFEVWNYRHIDGIGDNIDIEFVDTCMCGDYHMTMDRGEKDALLHVPGAGQTLYEQQGRAKQSDRFNGGMEHLGDGPLANTRQSKQFDRLEQFTKLQAAPEIKFKDLEAFLVNHTVLTGPPFPFDVRTDFVKVTDDTVLMPLTLQIKTRDITFNAKDGVSKGTVNILGRVTTIAGRVVQTFEEPVGVEIPSELLPRSLDIMQLYWKAIPLRPGRYRIDIAIKDVNNEDHKGTWARSVIVPKYDEDKLSASSLILADKMERVPSKEIGTGNFIIGNTKLRPRVTISPATPASFKRSGNLNFWMQVYNLNFDEKTKQNSAVVQYQVMDTATSKVLIDQAENSKTLGANSDQLTLEKSFSLASLQPGKYELKIIVTDNVSKQAISPAAQFTVE